MKKMAETICLSSNNKKENEARRHKVLRAAMNCFILCCYQELRERFIKPDAPPVLPRPIQNQILALAPESRYTRRKLAFRAKCRALKCMEIATKEGSRKLIFYFRPGNLAFTTGSR